MYVCAIQPIISRQNQQVVALVVFVRRRHMHTENLPPFRLKIGQQQQSCTNIMDKMQMEKWACGNAWKPSYMNRKSSVDYGNIANKAFNNAGPSLESGSFHEYEYQANIFNMNASLSRTQTHTYAGDVIEIWYVSCSPICSKCYPAWNCVSLPCNNVPSLSLFSSLENLYQRQLNHQDIRCMNLWLISRHRM